MEIKELVVYEKEYPERKAVFSEFPQDMLPELKGYLCLLYTSDAADE